MGDIYRDINFKELGNEIDLHHFNPKDTHDILIEFINYALANGIKDIIIIHGKGRSVKKREVIKILKSLPGVIDFSDEKGNWGATRVFLEKTTG